MKRALAVLLAVIMTAAFLPVSAQRIAVKGDVNSDGAVAADDALMALQYAVEKVIPDDMQRYSADVDSDGEITGADALMVLQYYCTKLRDFPCFKVSYDTQASYDINTAKCFESYSSYGYDYTSDPPHGVVTDTKERDELKNYFTDKTYVSAETWETFESKCIALYDEDFFARYDLVYAHCYAPDSSYRVRISEMSDSDMLIECEQVDNMGDCTIHFFLFLIPVEKGAVSKDFNCRVHRTNNW